MAETTGPSWSDIPVDLAGRILRHLPAYVDRLRFAAVCPQWRAAARLGPLPPPLPLLLLSDSTVYSLPGSKPLHLLVPCCCTGYTDVCGNWLFFSGDDGCFLRNPFSNTTMALPALSLDRIRYVGDKSVDEFYLECEEDGRLEYEPDRCKLLFCSLDLVVAIVSLWSGRRLAVCKPGAATSWWYVSADGQYSDFVGMTFHQGKLYALTSMDELFAIEVSLDHSTGDPWVTQMRPVINNPPLFIPAEFFMETKVTYLVEARGALLMVLRKMQPCYAQGVTGIAIFETTAGVQNEFEVFQANFRKSQWTKVTTLGDDQILFLRQQCCESVCVSHDEVPGDCIFFLENEDEDRLWSKASSSSCSVYSMRDGKISTPLPTVSWKRGTVFATWLFPEN
ncbi:hypothetical protein HU200_034573 [Digitaria exilis]|uniref:DUF295 domain-containing protein n=1 Tax=Digitaria exilis TaxID=1010633 RepID=A0A835BPX7_9POAL|nr:hypothetical protein HU200_034573 [Digitaria exilis]